QTVNLFLDHLPDVLRRLQSNLLRLDFELPLPVKLSDQTAINQVINHVDHKERAAVRALMNQTRESGRETVVSKSRGQILAHRRFAQKFQRELFTPPAHLQLLLDRLQRVPARNHFSRAADADAQQTRRLPAPPRGSGLFRPPSARAGRPSLRNRTHLDQPRSQATASAAATSARVAGA